MEGATTGSDRESFFSLQRLFEYVSGSTEWASVESISRLVKLNVTFWENRRTFDLFPSPVDMFGNVVDDSRFLFSVIKLYSKSPLKFNYEVNFEGIKMSLLRSSPTLLVKYKSVEVMNFKCGEFSYIYLRTI